MKSVGFSGVASNRDARDVVATRRGSVGRDLRGQRPARQDHPAAGGGGERGAGSEVNDRLNWLADRLADFFAGCAQRLWMWRDARLSPERFAAEVAEFDGQRRRLLAEQQKQDDARGATG